MSTRVKVMSVAVTIVLGVAVAAPSQWLLRAESNRSLLRLSWRTEPIRVEECRTLTEEELADVPAHMRRAEECTGYHVDYELRLSIDGRDVYVDTMAPSGLRRDRPVYVIHDEPLTPGDHRVEVRFSALVPRGFVSDGAPVELVWSGSLGLAPYEIGLITLDPTGRTLVRATAPTT